MIRFECALPKEEDARLVFTWRNDPVTRSMSFDSSEKKWDSFSKEYMDRCFSVAELPPLFILQDAERVGFIFFNLTEHPLYPHMRTVDISINISPEHRGKSIGRDALISLNDWVCRQGFDAIIAHILEKNSASKKAFASAGYQFVKKEKRRVPTTREVVEVEVYLAQFSPLEEEDSVFVIAEAGSNWHIGDDEKKNIAQSFALIDAAAQSGADAIKFQVFKAKDTYVKNAGVYLDDDVGELFDRLSMPYDLIPDLAEHCHRKGIEFMASAFSLNDFKAIDPFVLRHKIASYEISHPHLISAVAKSGKPVYLSTGAASIHDISWAVDLFHQEGGEDLTLLQCTACYPAPPEAMNLTVLAWLRQHYQTKVGLSDHSLHPLTAPVAATILGATVIEKHFTLDRSLPGPDHSFAITPDELSEMVDAIERAQAMRGSGAKFIDAVEEDLRSFAQRRIQAIQPIKKGQVLQEGLNVAILRPGNQPSGLHPRFLQEIEGKKAARAIREGEGIVLGDYE